MRPFEVRDIRTKSFYRVDDAYLNGYARVLKPTATAVYNSLCRHADINQESFPSLKTIAEEHGIAVKSVQRAIKKLKEYNIIHYEQIRGEKGKWLRNRYTLLDKSAWKKPGGQNRPTANRRTFLNNTGGQNRPTKETHNNNIIIINNNNNINNNTLKSITTQQVYGNKDINFLISYLKEKLGIPLLDGSEKINRRYCWLCLKKFGGVDKVKLLIETASQNNFWATKITSFQQLYYKGVRIISETRGGGKIGFYRTK